MRNILQNRISFYVSTLATVVLSFACAPQGGSPGAASDAPNHKTPVAQGTVSGGGGNGCNGAAFETYSKKLSTLEEYRLYIHPILRRMTEEGSDPLVTYLLWAAEEKAWYFIPCELQKISTEQIGLSVESDQLARHGEHGVYIHSIEDDPKKPRDPKLPPLKTYAQKKSKEKAVLLLHEMIMGARLLMKKSARDQCTALAKKDANLCLDAAVTQIAETKSIDAKESMIMDAQDHEAIRSMTSALAEKGADLSAEKIRATRERLGFNFPWSRAVSYVEMSDVMNALERSKMLGDRYAISKDSVSHFDGEIASCSIQHSVRERNVSRTHLNVVFVSSNPVNNAKVADFFKRFKTTKHGTVCSDSADRVYEPFVYDPKTGDGQTRNCEGDKYRISWSDYRLHFHISQEEMATRGILIDGVAFDEVRMEIPVNSSMVQMGQSRIEGAVIRVLLTREKSPRLQSIRFEPKQILQQAAKPGTERGKLEMLEIPGVSALECVRQSAI